MKISPLIRTLLPLAMISMAAVPSSRAGILVNALTNGDFETQNPVVGPGGKIATGFSTLTNWADVGTQPGNPDSGIQGTSNSGQPAQSGSYFVFEQGNNNGTNGIYGAFQITGTTLNAGDQLSLIWYAQNSYQNPVQEVRLLSAASSTFNNTTFNLTSTLATANSSTNAANYGLTGAFTKYTLTYTALAADAGKYVGVSLANVGFGGSYINSDNFALSITSAVPEPRTYGLVIAGAVAALIVACRRKQMLS